MKIVKYVINNQGIPILFSRDMLHSDLKVKTVSAGFAIITYNSASDKFIVKCYGGSDSLQLGMGSQDCFTIQDFLNDPLCTIDFDFIDKKVV